MPLLFRYTTPLLGVWKMDETSDELLAMLGDDASTLEGLRQLTAERRRREWLASRVLLKTLMGKECRVAYHADGAPYLPDSTLYISISHTEGYAAVLLQKEGAAGIDIERRQPRVLRVRSRFLSEAEDAEVASSKDDEVSRLLVYWCAKEALYKMIRQEEVDFARHLHVEPFRLAEKGEIRAYETRTSMAQGFDLRYEVTPDFVLVYNLPTCP